jgi:hypothetical protein
MAARGEEYRRARAGAMSAAEMSRVDINPDKFPQREDWTSYELKMGHDN